MSTKIKTVVQIKVPFQRVVERVADFGSLSAWHPGFRDCEVEGEGPGAVRTAKLADGVVRDRLDEIAEDGRGYRYTRLEGPVVCDEHHGYLWVRPAEDGAEATVEWAAKVKGAQFPDAAVKSLVEGIIEIGLHTVKAELENET